MTSRRLEAAWLVLAAFALLSAGCGSDGPRLDPEERVLPQHCNPIAANHCLLPWPSSFYLAPDAQTVTGYRLSYAEQALPVSKEGRALDPARYNRLDGFSIGSQPIVSFVGGVSSAGLPTAADPRASLSAEALVTLVDLERGERVALFAEPDANAAPEQAALIVRPEAPLRFNARYAVVVRRGLRDAAGELIARPPAFDKVVRALPSRSAALTAESERLAPLIDELGKLGYPREDLLLAWDFHTASRDAVQRKLLALVDDGLARLGSAGPSYRIDEVTEPSEAEDPDRVRILRGTMTVPSYVDVDDPAATARLDDAGLARYVGERSYPFQVNVPRCASAASGPLPVLIFGHGLFGSAQSTMSEPFHGVLSQRLCALEIGTDWTGLSKPDLAQVAARVIPDFSKLHWVTDRLQQAHLNFQALVQLAGGALLEDPALQLGGKALSDGRRIGYMGISNGGIQGGIFAALSKGVQRHALHVTGGWWSMILQRSSHFTTFNRLIAVRYPDPLDRLILLHLSQTIWDDADPINYAAHVINAPLPGRSPKKILYQEGLDDDRLPNVATRALARAYGLPLLAPAVHSVYGIPREQGPLDAAYVQFDTQPPVRSPADNREPPRLADDLSPHNALRWKESCLQQLQRFFGAAGRVEHTCGEGPCVVE